MERIVNFLKSLGFDETARVEKLAGDASDRRFYRVFLENKSLILMESSGDGPFIEAPVRLYHPSDGELPYVNIGRYLKRIGVPVPAILGTDERYELVLMEDMGERLLSEVAAERPELARPLYRRAVEILVGLQAGGLENPDPECLAFQMEFGYPIIRWELEHFLEFGIERRFGKLPPSERDRLSAELDALALSIDELPKVLMHRDYHARNLIVNESGEIGVLDFQDALIGPETYDIASLLFDAYIDLDDEFKAELIGYYLELRSARGLPERDFAAFYASVKKTALQRYLKIIGRFVFLAREKGKPQFLSYLPKVERNAVALMAGLPELEGLGKLVKPYIARGEA